MDSIVNVLEKKKIKKVLGQDLNNLFLCGVVGLPSDELFLFRKQIRSLGFSIFLCHNMVEVDGLGAINSVYIIYPCNNKISFECMLLKLPNMVEIINDFQLYFLGYWEKGQYYTLNNLEQSLGILKKSVFFPYIIFTIKKIFRVLLISFSIFVKYCVRRSSLVVKL